MLSLPGQEEVVDKGSFREPPGPTPRFTFIPRPDVVVVVVVLAIGAEAELELELPKADKKERWGMFARRRFAARARGERGVFSFTFL